MFLFLLAGYVQEFPFDLQIVPSLWIRCPCMAHWLFEQPRSGSNMWWRNYLNRMRISALPTVDEHVGGRLREFRATKGLSSQLIAAAIGISPTRLALFEAGRRRISASQLFVLAKLFDVPVAAFFDRREATL